MRVNRRAIQGMIAALAARRQARGSRKPASIAHGSLPPFTIGDPSVVPLAPDMLGQAVGVIGRIVTFRDRGPADAQAWRDLNRQPGVGLLATRGPAGMLFAALLAAKMKHSGAWHGRRPAGRSAHRLGGFAQCQVLRGKLRRAAVRRGVDQAQPILPRAGGIALQLAEDAALQQGLRIVGIECQRG